MEAIFLDCGAGAPQLKRNPLGSPTMRPHLLALNVALLSLAACTPPAPSGSTPPQVTSCAGKPSPDSTVYDTSQVSERPIRRSGPMPIYPPSASLERIQGTVVVAVVIERDGTIDPNSVQLVQRADSRLEESATQTVVGTTFWPACRDGFAVRIRVAIPVNYRVRG